MLTLHGTPVDDRAQSPYPLRSTLSAQRRIAAMSKRDAVVPEGQHFILTSLSPGPTQKRLARAVLLGLLIVFVLITFGPLSGVHLRRVDAFVPAYVTAMFVCDSITAILLY